MPQIASFWTIYKDDKSIKKITIRKLAAIFILIGFKLKEFLIITVEQPWPTRGPPLKLSNAALLKPLKNAFWSKID
jgi:hypothetical protein